MQAENFVKQFDDDVDAAASLDLSRATRLLQEPKQVNLDVPPEMMDSLDRAASKPGVAGQSVINFWIAKRLQATMSNLPLQRKRAGVAYRRISRSAEWLADRGDLTASAAHTLRVDDMHSCRNGGSCASGTVDRAGDEIRLFIPSFAGEA